MLYWKVYIEPLSGWDLILGKGCASLPEEYFTGIMKLIYTMGLTGCIAFYVSLLSFFLSRSDNLVKVLVFLFGGLMIVGDQLGFIPMLFRFALIIASFIKACEIKPLNKFIYL